MVMTAPVVRVPTNDLDMPDLVTTEAGIYIDFSAGRRGAGSIDCLVCGTRIHQHVEADGEPWFDGSGDDGGMTPTHMHEPAFECGPVFGPFEYTEVTYTMLRVTDGHVLAVWDDGRGDWLLTAFAGAYEGQAYSDATMSYRAGE